MVNSESHSSNDQVPPSTTCSPHEGGCKEAEDKLTECMLTLPKVKELTTKAMTSVFKTDASHDVAEDKFADYMKGGACKEPFMALSECPDRDNTHKQIAMLKCMEAHSDYYHKYNEIIDKQVSKEVESMFPGGEVKLALGVHEFFTKGEGDCCKEQYFACMDCLIEEGFNEEEEEEFGPGFINFGKWLLRLL
ncbi:hypothetical protein HID58_036931 [Brassica napus]|nr:hypothetical protein HID58_036931 [Brassica napus]CAF2052115.1 unnamed protein product [Brassica napus]